MSHYNGWNDVPLTPEEAEEVSAAALQRLRAEAFRRGMTEVDQAGDMLAVERARAARWKMGAERFRLDAKSERRIADYWRHAFYRIQKSYSVLAYDMEKAWGDIARLTRERDEARAALERITRDAA